MSVPVARTCTELSILGAATDDALPRPLADFRTTHAYVLLGDPGLGKTTALEVESSAHANDAQFLTARNFLLRSQDPDELRGKTLFIDGLDEVRAGKADYRTPFDEIRAMLVQLGRPKFRITCREADWLGESDRRALAYVVPNLSVLRLNPLSAQDILAILRNSLDVSRPEDFVEQAREAGLESLLKNPQTLELLVRAVRRGNGWPEGRRQVFELACRELAGESNLEHEIATRNGPAADSVIDCAGRLCVLLLLSDKTGYSLDRYPIDEEFVPRDLCGIEDRETLRAAVSSKLFRGRPVRCFRPIHRQIAEFLGSKHLARLIAAGMSPRRALALMKGGDGEVVTALRGLSAWLATHSVCVRDELIRMSPVDLGTYGDLSALSEQEKQRTVEALLAQPKSLWRAVRVLRRFSPLVTAHTEPQVLAALRSQNRDSDQQARVGFLLLLLSESQRLPGIANTIAETVRDRTWPPQVRQDALDALVRYERDSPVPDKELKSLLDEFKDEGISIANRDLCGTLLSELYPKTVRPSQVWKYFTHLGGDGSWGRYFSFWRRHLVARSTDDDIAELLDTLAAALGRLRPTICALRLWDLPLELLRRGLHVNGERLDIDRGSAWLGACVSAAERREARPSEALRDVRAWLEHHPSFQKQVILDRLVACKETDRIGPVDFNNRRKLLGSRLPADFGQWCLEQAVRLADSKPEVAKHLFQEAWGASVTPGEEEALSTATIREQVRGHAPLEDLLEQLQTPTPARQERASWDQQQEAPVAGQEPMPKGLLESVRLHRRDLLHNRAPPYLLNQLALVYFGEHPDAPAGSRGAAEIARVLRDPAAVHAAMHGLRRSVKHADLPSSQEVIRLAKNQTEHYISLPLLAALEEAPDDVVVALPESTSRTCVACLHCWEPEFMATGSSNLAWYEQLLDHRPKIVWDVAAKCAAGLLRERSAVPERFWELVTSAGGESNARDAVLRLMRTLPTRCTARQIEVLDGLIWTGLKSAWRSNMSAVVKGRLSRSGMDAGQRVRWLGLGLILDPDTYRDDLAAAITGREPLTRHLARFLVHGGDRWYGETNLWHYALEDLSASDLALIIRLLGRFFPPREPSVFITASAFVDHLIQHLESIPLDVATTSLESLSHDPQLSGWKDRLSRARTRQRTVRRDAEFRHPELQQVCNTLGSGLPANVGDFAALLVDKFRALSDRIRTSNSNEWRQYWNEGKHGKPVKPKVEAACRDALLTALRPLLPESVTAEPECQMVNQTRSDLVIQAGEFKIPVETKKNSHRHLWSAPERQLIAKYTREPTTGGYGIYLVFWFGKDYQRARGDGAKPADPAELESLLRHSLPEEAANKIEIVVIDASRPASSPDVESRDSKS